MTLQDLLVLKLKALYDIETQLTKALPKMAAHANDPDLRLGFEHHLKETKEHARRLERAFRLLSVKPSATKVEAIRGLIADAEWIIKQKPGDAALDAMLVAAAGYVEHYEMAGYMSASMWAVRLGHHRVSELLRQTLDEEVKAATKLNVLSEKKIDRRAMMVGIVPKAQSAKKK